MLDPSDAHAALQRDLATVCTGRFEPYRHKLAVGAMDGPDLMSGREMVASRHLDRVREALARERECTDPRVLFSLWTRLYGDVVIPAVLVANLTAGRDLPVALDEVRFAVDADGKPQCLVLGHGGGRLPPGSDPAARFGTLIEGNLGPFVDAVARHGGVSSRLLWGSLASYFEWTAHVLTTYAGVSPDRVAPVEALFGSQDRQAGATRSLIEALASEGRDAQGLRWRRVCCIRYLIPALAGAYCGNCPIRRQDGGRAARKVSQS